MKRLLCASLLASLALVGCGLGRKGSAGFHMPDGDSARGQAVFVSLRCHSCHRVAGATLPAPVVEPTLVVTLGGDVPVPHTDGDLVAAIIDPSHRLALGYDRAAVTSGRLSRMGDFGETMSVRDLTDVVAFLQSRYEVVNTSYPQQ